MGSTVDAVLPSGAVATTPLTLEGLRQLVTSRLLTRLRWLSRFSGQPLTDVIDQAVSFAWELQQSWDPEQGSIERRVVWGVRRWIADQYREDRATFARMREVVLEPGAVAALASLDQEGKPDLLHMLAAADQWKRVMEAIMDLPPLMRAALLMPDDTTSDRHIAVLFNRQESAVRMARKAARERLARMGFSAEA